ncbi:MFS transporter [Paenibacillus hamazuiensis]|uniref:MFS transporter n=1 Tax=Paenibacillus hamazuiensis TaxID=2936508 RepID=UPI00200FC853|nr:MFS transporter [Paenibacillus hamazuiensis]
MIRKNMLFRNGFVQAILMSGLFSQCGIWVRNFAVLLYVMDISGGDSFAVSMISVAEYAPIFLFSFIGGVFADRWRPKKTIVWCELLSSLSVLIVFLLLETGSWKTIFLATLCSSILSQFAQPAGMKLFKLHVPDEQAPLCMSLLQTLFSLFMVAGPVMGTLVYRQFGIQFAMLLTCLCFMLSALAILFIPPDRSGKSAHESAKSAALLRDMANGLRYVRERAALVRLTVCFALVGLGVGILSPLSIFLVTERLGLSAGQLPWISVPYGLGEIAGGIATFALAAKVSPLRLLLAGLLANAFGILVSGWSSALWLTMAAQFVIALFQPAIFAGNQALVMKHTDPAYIGRVTGIRTPLMTGSMLLATGCAGALKHALSLPTVYGLAAMCFLAGSLVIVRLNRKKTGMDG